MGRLDAMWAQHIAEHSVLEGISAVNCKIAQLNGNPASFRASEDDAFQECMEREWERNWPGVEPRIEREDHGEQVRCWKPHLPGEVCNDPVEAKYVTTIRFRRS